MNWWFIFIIIVICVILPRNNKFYFEIIKRKKEGRTRIMPKELIKDFLGKSCTIILFNESFGIQGKLVAIEENWIKIEEKNRVRIINGDMIRDISLNQEKINKKEGK